MNKPSLNKCIDLKGILYDNREKVGKNSDKRYMYQLHPTNDPNMSVSYFLYEIPVDILGEIVKAITIHIDEFPHTKSFLYDWIGIFNKEIRRQTKNKHE